MEHLPWLIAGPVVAVVLIHAAIFFIDTSWIYKNVDLIYRGISDPAAKEEAARREANPPWYHRYAEWVDAELARKKGDR